MVTLVNRAKVSTSTTGTGTITLGAAADGYQTFADAGVTDGQTVRYVIEDGSNWEIGTGVYTASGTTLSRTVSESSNSDAAINLSGTATVFVGATAADLVQAGPSLQAVASGALSDGSAVIINTDGTISVVAGATGTKTLGATSAISGLREASVTYDSTNNKIVVLYRNSNNSNFGTAVVGTVSGTSISFGTPVVFASTSADFITASYNPTANKIVVAYRADTFFFGMGYILGTVSGTTISFGTATAASDLTRRGEHFYDSSSGNTIFIGVNGSSFPTGVIGSISGDTITLGTPVVFLSASANTFTAAFDDATKKVIAYYSNGNDSNYGYATVGTVSGTSISFGSNTRLYTSALSNSASYYDTSQNVVVLFGQEGTQYGQIRAYSISGTTLTSAATPLNQTFNSAAINRTAVFDPVAQKGLVFGNGDIFPVVVSGGVISRESPTYSAVFGGTLDAVYDSGSGLSVMIADTSDVAFTFTHDYSVSNMTAENFIGFSNASYADTDTATVQLIGAVDDAQTGLTAGQKYYVQKDGALSTSPDTPEVYAGIAVASNKIIVKG